LTCARAPAPGPPGRGAPLSGVPWHRRQGPAARVALHGGTWLAPVGRWPCARPAARDRWIGWSLERWFSRLRLIRDNSRIIILTPGRVPDLASHAPSLGLRRLSACIRAVHDYPASRRSRWPRPGRAACPGAWARCPGAAGRAAGCVTPRRRSPSSTPPPPGCHPEPQRASGTGPRTALPDGATRQPRPDPHSHRPREHVASTRPVRRPLPDRLSRAPSSRQALRPQNEMVLSISPIEIRIGHPSPANRLFHPGQYGGGRRSL